MTDREKLIALLESDDCPLLYVLGENMGTLADHLIAHGVVVRETGEWTSTDIIGRKAGYGVRYYHHADCPVNPCRLFECESDFCPNCGADMRKGENG